MAHPSIQLDASPYKLAGGSSRGRLVRSCGVRIKGGIRRFVVSRFAAVLRFGARLPAACGEFS
jgi:hypothetical protein